MTTNEYLDAVKALHGLTSDYALSKLLGVTQSSIQQYRSGRSALGIETAMKVGEILSVDGHFVDGHKVYADGQIERAKNSAQSAFWKDIAEKFSESFKLLLPGCSPRQFRV